jgi:uncharacterized protein (DUF924 family)
MNFNADAVLDFWFGAPGSPAFGTVRSEWFRKDAAFDASIREQFGSLVDWTLAGSPAAGDASPVNLPSQAPAQATVQAPSHSLARIIALDQFTRNIHRGSPSAFAGDAQALTAAIAMVASGQDAALRPEQRVFAYLPFEHSEDLSMQDRAVDLFAKLVAGAPELAAMLDYAHKHRAVIARFGRFPHRNEVLGRSSTAEESAFLQTPGSRF